MIDTAPRHPPCADPRSNPLLIGIAEARAALDPLIERTPQKADAAPGGDRDGHAEHEAASRAP